MPARTQSRLRAADQVIVYPVDLAKDVSGTLPTSNLGTATASSAVFLRGDSTWANTLLGEDFILSGVTPQMSVIGSSGANLQLDFFSAGNGGGGGIYDITNTKIVLLWSPTGGSGGILSLGDAGTITSVQAKFLVVDFTRLSGLQTNIITKAVDYTVILTDHTILVDATAANRTITLPTAASASGTTPTSGMVLIVKKIDASANTVTIDGNGTETIDGALTQVLTTQWETKRIQSNGTAWFVI